MCNTIKDYYKFTSAIGDAEMMTSQRLIINKDDPGHLHCVDKLCQIRPNSNEIFRNHHSILHTHIYPQQITCYVFPVIIY